VKPRVALLCLACAACGSTTAPTKAPPPVVEQAKPPLAVDDHARRDEIVAAHRKLEEEEQDALGASCTEPEPREHHDRCLPSCYSTEPADPRAGKKLAGAIEVQHLACAHGGEDAGPFVFADELDAAKLVARTVRGRIPAAHRKGTWQATVETTLTEAAHPKLAHGDVIVASGAWRDLTHPLTKERLRCVTVSHYIKAPRRTLDGCGGDGAIACEATGNAAARGINVVHYRLAEARALQAAAKPTECQQAALEAVAVARGLPRWRQYAKLNVAQWAEHAGYRTRFDGTLDEDALFATAATLGAEAETVYVACGGAVGAKTTPTQEQSFHTCW
jgi:hypothetical protein